MTDNTQKSSHTPAYNVFTVTRGTSGKGFWTNIGGGWVNKDGSINVKLNCLPLDGQLVIRKVEPRAQEQLEEIAAQGDSNSDAPPDVMQSMDSVGGFGGNPTREPESHK